MYKLLAICFLCLSINLTYAQGPRVLVIDAHPDDETTYAGTIYKLTHELHGTADLVVVTNGEAGFKYSTLAESYYHLKLTDEAVGRKYLPGIREKELNAAGKIIGLHHIYYLHQKDNHYTQNVHEVLDDTTHVWNLSLVRSKLQSILRAGHYDFVFTLLPTDSTHGHHKAATILGLEAVQSLPATIPHPIVLAGSTVRKGQPPLAFTVLDGYPLTQISDAKPTYSFDLTQSFGFRHALNYKMIVNWLIAEHKSQGTIQLGVGNIDSEEYYYYDINPSSGRAKTQQLFDALAQNTHPELTYPNLK